MFFLILLNEKLKAKSLYWSKMKRRYWISNIKDTQTNRTIDQVSPRSHFPMLNNSGYFPCHLPLEAKCHGEEQEEKSEGNT